MRKTNILKSRRAETAKRKPGSAASGLLAALVQKWRDDAKQETEQGQMMDRSSLSRTSASTHSSAATLLDCAKDLERTMRS